MVDELAPAQPPVENKLRGMHVHGQGRIHAKQDNWQKGLHAVQKFEKYICRDFSFNRLIEDKLCDSNGNETGYVAPNATAEEP